MAEKKNTKTESVAKTEEVKSEEVKATAKAATVHETKYSINDLVEASERFGVKPVIAKTALLCDGKEAYTISEAHEIINSFKNKEVKA